MSDFISPYIAMHPRRLEDVALAQLLKAIEDGRSNLLRATDLGVSNIEYAGMSMDVLARICIAYDRYINARGAIETQSAAVSAMDDEANSAAVRA